VVNNNGQSVSGALVGVNGVSSAYDNWRYSDSDGKVCVEGIAGSTANVSISYSFDGVPYSTSEGITMPNGYEGCSSSCSFQPDCEIELPL